MLQVLGRWVNLPIHGTFASHISEYLSYGRDRWVRSFEHPKLVQLVNAPLLCFTQFGFFRFRFMHLRKWLARHGFASTRVFVMRKTQ